MQKILIISNVFPLEKNTSRGCYILAQAKLLKSAGYDVKIVNPLPFIPPFYSNLNKNFRGFKDIKKNRTVENITIFHPRYFCFPGTLFPKKNQTFAKGVLPKIYHWLGDWKPDIVHLHSIHPLLQIGNNISKKFNSRFFITVHGWDFDVGIKKNGIAYSIQKISPNITGICVVNETHQSIAKRFVGNEKTYYIPCHIDIRDEDKREINDFDSTNKKINLLFPANPSRPEKNYPLFLMTIKKLEERGWKIKKDNLGNLSRKNTLQKFHWADLILLTSKREGGPLVTKEAIYCGTRVVSTSVGDSAKWLPLNSVSNDFAPQTLANNVENALRNNPKTWKVPQKFERTNVLKKLIDLYHIN